MMQTAKTATPKSPKPAMIPASTMTTNKTPAGMKIREKLAANGSAELVANWDCLCKSRLYVV